MCRGPVFTSCLPTSAHPDVCLSFSPHVRQHLWQRLRHHPEIVLRHGALSRPNATRQGVHTFSPDPQPAEATAGGVFPALLDLHQWHRHEYGKKKKSPFTFASAMRMNNRSEKNFLSFVFCVFPVDPHLCLGKSRRYIFFFISLSTDFTPLTNELFLLLIPP